MPAGRPPSTTEALRAQLRKRGRSTVDLAADRPWLEEITSHPGQLLQDMSRRQIAHRLQRGRYHVNVDDGLKSEAPLIDALEPLANALLERIGAPYYLSWHTALYHYGLLEQQAATVFCAVATRKANATFFGFKVRFVFQNRRRFFGIEPAAGFTSSVRIATVEKALLDGLERPELTAPFPVVIAAFAQAAQNGQIQESKLVRYAMETGRPALARRTGYLMDRYGLTTTDELLDRWGRPRYAVPLAPGGSAQQGDLDRKWGVRVPSSLLDTAERLK